MLGNTETSERAGSISPRDAWADRPLISTELLRSFIWVCELGSFTKAARQIGLTQPAITAQLKRLELAVGARLLDRSKAGVRLTVRGREILAYARRMLEINDQMLIAASSRGTPAVRLGVPNMFAACILRALVDDAHLSTLNGSVQLFCDNSRNLLEEVKNEKLELACIFGNRLDEANVVSSWDEEIVWVRSPDCRHDISRRVPVIGSSGRCLSSQMALAALTKASRNFEVVLSANDWSIRCAAMRRGFGYLTMPRRLVPDDLVIEEHGLPSLRNMGAGIVTRNGVDPKEISKLLGLCESVVRRPASGLGPGFAVDGL